MRIWQLDRMLEDDYQESRRFREYVERRLEDFLLMAAGGDGLWGIWGYDDGTYYGGGYDGYLYEDFGYGGWNLPTQAVEGDLLEAGQLEGIQSELGVCQEEMESYPEFAEQRKPLTDGQKQKLAQKYHESIKGDKNLLYTVSYDGKVLYGNSDTLMEEGIPSVPEGIPSVPEGYNFLLYFDGEKARIYKDGEEIDVYGDGYYRDESDWYLPGYANFQADDTVKKASVCIAVAKDPVLYTEGAYGSGGARQYDNSLYWMNANQKDRRANIVRGFYGLSAGLVLLFLAFLWRKSLKEAAEGIAGFQAKIWLECKVFLLLMFLCGLYIQCRIFMLNSYGYDLWEEWYQAYAYDYNMEAAVWFARDLAGSIPPLAWITLFWGIWLIWNDLRHHKKIWQCSLMAKVYRTFSAKALTQPMTKTMSRRNGAVFAITIVYGILMLGGMAVSEYSGSWGALTAVRILAVLGTVLFLVFLYLAGAKNMKVARDVETLSDRITQIRNGDYGDVSGGGEDKESTGGSLESVMAQLEDIRHGMAMAVDEQMKSERMKVELIANVSHDIKTPLTSIISYVEILKQEEGLPDYVKDYIKILDEKSQRLHQMVQDVFAVSKAASGELPMQMEELDFGKLLWQTLADMEEQIMGSDVTFRTEIPDAPVMILADGQRMYRVFQNLFQNAIKYSLQGSRVYVTLEVEGQLAQASVKNTSRQEIDKSRDFAERFTRGDQSRTDGGSGLGLSIAQSFTEACGGEFSWETDADLFVVRVLFKIQ
ncbi:MAG: HAMP domain-containing histidine kinase [Lachnospiraceae bacterium]|nr:HAMP domain-containing histidine kinase [Lachnospiraceae bacterium]